MPQIAVLLTCFNRQAKTKACLGNLFEQKLPKGYVLEVFICDDASTDGTGEMLRADFPQVRTVRGNGNLYWGGGMIEAWKLAKSSGSFDTYLWLNDDTFLLPNALEKLINEFEELGGRSILTAACRIPGTQMFSYGGHQESMAAAAPNGSIQEVFYINGNLVLIPKEVEEKIGMISTKYTHFLGDFDFGFRAKKAGFKCYTTSVFLAECASNPMVGWDDPEVPLRKRWKMTHDVKGRAISEYVAFKSYHFGKIVGFKSMVDAYLKMLFTDNYTLFRNFLMGSKI